MLQMCAGSAAKPAGDRGFEPYVWDKSWHYASNAYVCLLCWLERRRVRDVCLCKNTSCGLGRRLAPPFGCGDLRIVVACPALAAIDASSGGGLPHLRFSTALFAALAGERRATRYHPCTDPSVVGSGQPRIAQSLARDQSRCNSGATAAYLSPALAQSLEVTAAPRRGRYVPCCRTDSATEPARLGM